MAQTYTPLTTGATPTLGTSGDAVKAIQTSLNERNKDVQGYVPLKVDGLYGPLTQAARDMADKNGITSMTTSPQNNTGTSTLGQQNATGVNTTSAGTGSVVSTSNPVVADEKNITSTVQNMANDNTAITQAHNDYLATLDRQSSALETRRAAEEASINASFDTKTRQTTEAQKGETGTFTSTLARIGGYLGDSASAQGALVNLNQQHTYQLNDLESKRQSALQEARNAVTDKQFDLARAKAAEAKDYSKAIQDSKQQFFQNSMAILKNNRDEQDQQAQTATNLLKGFSEAGVDPSKIPQASKDTIDAYYKTPGFADKYITAATAAASAKSQKEVNDAHKAYIDVLQAVPTGQKVTMPDGSIITGMGKASDIETFNKEDANGRVTVVSVNKLTGALHEYSAGNIGSPSSGGDSAPVLKSLSTYTQAFQQLPIDANGFIVPAKDNSGGVTTTPVGVYNQLYKSFIQNNPGKADLFFKNYPPEHWLSPADRLKFTKSGL